MESQTILGLPNEVYVNSIESRSTELSLGAPNGVSS